MKDKEIDIYNYDKIVFVDASGDDGFCFGKTSSEGSSFLFVVSCVVIDPCDFEYNCNVLNSMKTALNLSSDKELKSTTLKRHRFALAAYNELENLKGDVFSFVAFKKSLANSKETDFSCYCDPTTKVLSGFTHTFPIRALTETKIIKNNQKVLIVIDRLKKTEEEAIDICYNILGITSRINSTVIYRDSNSKKFPLIQLADAIAGAVRVYFESNMSSNFLQKSCFTCNHSQKDCVHKSARKARKQLHFSNPEKIIFNLHRNRFYYNRIMLFSITTLPMPFYQRYMYIDCIFNDINKKRS